MAENLKLQHSESVVAHMASRIYAAYIAAGKVEAGTEDKWMKESIRSAIKICVATDKAVISDDEISGLGFN